MEKETFLFIPMGNQLLEEQTTCKGEKKTSVLLLFLGCCYNTFLMKLSWPGDRSVPEGSSAKVNLENSYSFFKSLLTSFMCYQFSFLNLFFHQYGRISNPLSIITIYLAFWMLFQICSYN